MISLKAYNNEIEQLIDNGLYDEAIAHCIHILATYPKCIDSYRNLGKSLLELKKYPEALDVFSRVLSAIPDDFIAHVGLSIIFEDQKNLDLAIWHMEQSFDVQPSNLAIQDELKRLFGQRDGERPLKIRLTRGALVRMYARGELYQQAITEILSILEEDPRRIDLEVILARMHYLSGSIEESEAVCTRIIEKIPFCFEANRILQQIHINKNENDNAVINKNRLICLDPYYQFMPSPFSEQEIPENKVLLEKLQYIPSIIADTHIPVWLEDIDASTTNASNESFTWLEEFNKNEISDNTIAVKPFSKDENPSASSLANLESQVDDDIPEWLKTAGWNANSGSTFVENTSDSNVQPSELINSNLIEPPSNMPNDIITENTTNVTNEDLALLFTELQEGKMENDNLAANENEDKQFPPSDWMSQFSNSGDTSSSDSSDQDFPDWLKNIQAEDTQITQDSDDMPEWLKNLQSEAEPISPSSNNVQIESAPEKLNPPDASPEDIVQVDSLLENNSLEETNFDKIFDREELNNNNVIDENDLSIKTELDGWETVDLTKEIPNEPLETVHETAELNYIPSDDKIPDWVKSVLINQNSDTQDSQFQESENLEDSIQSSEPEEPSLIVDSTEETSEIVVESDPGIISQQTNDELLDWLRGLKTEGEPVEQKEEVINQGVTTPESDIIQNISVNISQPVVEEQPAFVETEINHIFDQEQTDEFVQALPSTDFVSDSTVEHDESISSDSLPREITSEFVEIPSIIKPEEKIQTSELHLDSVLNELQDNSSEQLDELLTTGDFGKLVKLVTQNIAQGDNLDQMLSPLLAKADEHNNDFAYWQCLGDIYSKNNHLNDALLAYQKAEDILVKTISS